MKNLGQVLDLSILSMLVGVVACGGDSRAGEGPAGAASQGITGTGTEGGSPSTTEVETSDTSSADTDQATADASADSNADATDDAGDDEGEPGKFDTLGIPDLELGCLGGAGDFEYSFLWAANSDEGSISKLDTQSVTEVGRFIVRPDSNGSPSRTSVSLSGHVAVANRNGGVTKVYADEQFCQESNGQPGIQTSTDYDSLPWGQEECIAWYKPMAYVSQRPVAWGPAKFDQINCEWTEEELWTSGTNQNGSIDIYVLDGDDGTTKEMIVVPLGGIGLAGDFNGNYYGIYGGAADGNGDFWGTQLGGEAKLIRIRRADMTWQTWQPPTNAWWYGMTVDSDGMVWMCSDTVGRFDPQTETWATAQVGGSAGCMADAAEDGLLWMADGGGIVGVNRDTLQVEKMWPSNGSYGISIDFEGYVWAVAYGNNANKVDPATGQVWTYGGLAGAYTYSDMTGYALSNVGKPNG
jgi:hypothetical protein